MPVEQDDGRLALLKPTSFHLKKTGTAASGYAAFLSKVTRGAPMTSVASELRSAEISSDDDSGSVRRVEELGRAEVRSGARASSFEWETEEMLTVAAEFVLQEEERIHRMEAMEEEKAAFDLPNGGASRSPHTDAIFVFPGAPEHGVRSAGLGDAGWGKVGTQVSPNEETALLQSAEEEWEAISAHTAPSLTAEPLPVGGCDSTPPSARGLGLPALGPPLPSTQPVRSLCSTNQRSDFQLESSEQLSLTSATKENASEMAPISLDTTEKQDIACQRGDATIQLDFSARLSMKEKMNDSRVASVSMDTSERHQVASQDCRRDLKGNRQRVATIEFGSMKGVRQFQSCFV
ncbi:MAG: hypothetical protein SGPRY_008333 [Prymnesium sp.]